MAAADGYTQLNYGDPDLLERFQFLRSFFPEMYTVNEDVRKFPY